MSDSIFIDVIIPCHNAVQTLQRAVDSVLSQSNLGKIYLIDDGSTDDTWQLMTALKDAYPEFIHIERLPSNKGAAVARNWGVMLAKSEYIAFLDSDDSYQSQVLQACAMVFEKFNVGVIRLPLVPIGLSEDVANHAEFANAWRIFEMSAAGNSLFYRPYFLALGGFDDDDLFKKFGGEDGSLALAAVDRAQVATLFDNDGYQAGVNFYCHDSMHVKHLLDALLFGKNTRAVSQQDIDKACQFTQNAINRVKKLQVILNADIKRIPIVLS